MTIRKTLLASLALALATGVQAADLTAPNAAFNWTDANGWSGGTATWNSSTPGDAVFGDISTNRAVTLTSAVTAGDISFSNIANRWTISGTGGEITLNGALTKIGAGDVTISNPIVGGGSVSVSGGELYLNNGGNTFAGPLTVNSGGTLRVAANNAMGTGALIINGGTIYQSGGGNRSFNNTVTINGDFTARAPNTLTLSGNASLGTGTTRTITVGANADGTGAASSLLLTNVSGVGSNLVKEGEGIMRLSAASATGSLNVNNGTVEFNNGDYAFSNYNLAAGTLLRVLGPTAAVSSAPTLTSIGGRLALVQSGYNIPLDQPEWFNRRATFSQVQIGAGTTLIDEGAGLRISTSTVGTEPAGINILTGGVLGGNGTIQTGRAEQTINGVTNFINVDDAAITLGVGGSIRPGTVDALNSTIGTLSFGDLTWNGEDSAVAQMAFNLSGTSSSDQISLSGALTKGTGSNFLFDFQGFNATQAGTYTLMTFASQTGFVVGDFSATNITVAPELTGSFALNSDSLQFAVIPEPGTIALMGLFGLSALLVLRRRK